MARMLVIGASRGIGLETVKRALAAGHRVRALARGVAALPVEHAELEKIAGDALDSGTVAGAVDGMEAVIETLGAPKGPQAVIWGTDLFSQATRILIDAMRAKGVMRLVAVTGLGAGDSRGHGGFLYDAIAFPLILKRVYDDKDVQEQMIRASGLDWTIARPGMLTSGPATGRVRALTDAACAQAGLSIRPELFV